MGRTIKFLHPGPEWRPAGSESPDEGVAFWRQNGSGHTRRFLQLPGRFIRQEDGPVEEGDIGFWGEYEALTWYRRVAPRGRGHHHQNGFPRYIQQPVPNPLPCPGAMNTDPLVIGPDWIYSNCLQDDESVLRRLEPGDVVFFGSRVHREFVLDTVFVVASHPLEYVAGQAQAMLANQVPAHVHELVLDLVGPGRFSLYHGATFDNQVNGMFSFVPCLPLRDGPQGFARPAAPSPLQGGLFRNYQYKGLGDPKVNWANTVDAVLSKGLFLGVSLDLP